MSWCNVGLDFNDVIQNRAFYPLYMNSHGACIVFAIYLFLLLSELMSARVVLAWDRRVNKRRDVVRRQC